MDIEKYRIREKKHSSWIVLIPLYKELYIELFSEQYVNKFKSLCSDKAKQTNSDEILCKFIDTEISKVIKAYRLGDSIRAKESSVLGDANSLRDLHVEIRSSLKNELDIFIENKRLEQGNRSFHPRQVKYARGIKEDLEENYGFKGIKIKGASLIGSGSGISHNYKWGLDYNGELGTLPQGTSELLNDDSNIFLRRYAIGDGSCFIHSLLWAIDEKYRLDSSNKQDISKKLRKRLSNLVTQTHFDSYNLNLVADGFDSLSEYKKHLNSNSFIEGEEIALISSLLNVNIFIFSLNYSFNNITTPISESFPFNINKLTFDIKRPTALIYCMSGRHYEPIVSFKRQEERENGEIQHIFNSESDVIQRVAAKYLTDYSPGGEYGRARGAADAARGGLGSQMMRNWYNNGVHMQECEKEDGRYKKSNGYRIPKNGVLCPDESPYLFNERDDSANTCCSRNEEAGLHIGESKLSDILKEYNTIVIQSFWKKKLHREKTERKADLIKKLSSRKISLVVAQTFPVLKDDMIQYLNGKGLSIDELIKKIESEIEADKKKKAEEEERKKKQRDAKQEAQLKKLRAKYVVELFQLGDMGYSNEDVNLHYLKRTSDSLSPDDRMIKVLDNLIANGSPDVDLFSSSKSSSSSSSSLSSSSSSSSKIPFKFLGISDDQDDDVQDEDEEYSTQSKTIYIKKIDKNIKFAIGNILVQYKSIGKYVRSLYVSHIDEDGDTVFLRVGLMQVPSENSKSSTGNIEIFPTKIRYLKKNK